MSALTITSRGQVTLRKEIMRHLGACPGDKIIVDKLPDGRIELRARRATGAISDAFGMLRRDDGSILSIDDMNEITAAGWAGKK